MAHPWDAQLYPTSAVVLRALQRDALELVHVAEAWSCRTTGALCHATRQVLNGGQGGGPVVDALGPEHRLVRTLLHLRSEQSIALSPERALALDGFDTLFLELTGACNEQCIHCYANACAGRAEGLELQLCAAVLEDAAQLGFQRVQFTGGDPLLCAFLPRLLELARAVGIETCEIFTNGLLLHPPLLDALRPHDPSFALSFYSRDPAIHDAITRTPGSQQRTLQAIRRLLDAQIPVRIALIVMPQNVDSVAETIDELRLMGVDSIGITIARPVGRGAALTEFAFSDMEDATHRPSHPPSDTQADSNSMGGKLCVTYEGLVVPCIFNRRDILGDLRKRRLRDIVAAPWPIHDPQPTDEILDSGRKRLQCLSCQLTAYALRAATGQL